ATPWRTSPPTCCTRTWTQGSVTGERDRSEPRAPLAEESAPLDRLGAPGPRRRRHRGRAPRQPLPADRATDPPASPAAEPRPLARDGSVRARRAEPHAPRRPDVPGPRA